MRQGSTVFGRLGLVPAGIGMLVLPLCAAVIGFTIAPTPASAAPSETSLQAEREALAQRRQCRRYPTWWKLAARRSSQAARAPRPVRIINTRATWYGPGFHGRRTASGERFNQNAMTLASRHLPFGTHVRVVNPRTGKAAVGRVNDRGPFRGGYTADLSKALARRIGLGGSGPVRLEILGKKR